MSKLEGSSLVSIGTVVLAAAALAAALMWPRFDAPERVEEPAPAASASAAGVLRAEPISEPSATAAIEDVPALPPIDLTSRNLCPPDMVLVDGVYCPFVAHRCERYLDRVRRVPPPSGRLRRPEPEGRRCGEFVNVLICEGRPSRMHVCVDRLEYPNMPGVPPATVVSFDEASRACQSEGKRLCEASEWTFACEGPRTWPYPTGLTRDSAACNVDRRLAPPSPGALESPHDVALELERLDQRTGAGELENCLSPFGLYDMMGNVTEWVHDKEGRNHDPPLSHRVLKGGMWGPSLGECRASQRPGEWGLGSAKDSRTYHSGFRCCAETNDGIPATRLLDSSAKLPHRRKLR